MEVYKTPSKEIQEIILANVTYEAVIDGLNGYFTSEPRNEYITIKMEPDKQNFALYEAEAWADIFIEWLRKKHDIFYRPDLKLDQVEAARSAAKMCRLRAHIKDEIRKRGLWFGADEDIPELVDTLFKAYDEEGERADKNRKDAVKLSEEIRKLKVELNTLKDTVSRVRSGLNKKLCPLGYEDDLEKLADIALRAVDSRDETINRITRPWHDECEDAKKEAKQECYKYLWDRLRALSPECDALKITDYEDLVDRIFYEMSLVNDNCKKCRRKQSTEKFSYIQRTNKAEEEVKKLKEQKDRSFTILQDLYRDIFKKQPDGLSAEDIANKILDRVLETEDLLHKSVDSVNKECKATGKLMVEDYKLKLKSYILKDIKEHGYRYDGLQSKSIEEIVDWIIVMATSDHSFIVLKDIYTTVASPAERRRYNIDDCDGTIVDHMKDYILRRFEGLRINIEYCLKKMSELDGYKKHF